MPDLDNNALEEIYREIKGELVRASADAKHPCRYLSLSTIGSKGFPECRYIVLRKFSPESHQLLFFTDYRSPKVQELQINSRATVLGYHPKQRYQLRLKGNCRLNHNNELASQYYQQEVRQVSDYNAKKAPGTPVSSWSDGVQQKDHIDGEHFTVITFQISQIDWLKLDGKNGHKRALFTITKDQSIISTWLVP